MCDRPIRWILPIAPSGGSDMLARTIQGRFTESIGQQIVIDNRFLRPLRFESNYFHSPGENHGKTDFNNKQEPGSG